MPTGSVTRTGFFRGSDWSRVDKAGRVVIPSMFRRRLEEYGLNVFIARSFFTDFPHAVIYPIAVWQNIELNIFHRTDLAPLEKMSLIQQVNLLSQETQVDERGRVIIPAELRRHAELKSRVRVVGCFDAIQVWNPEIYDRFVTAHPMSQPLTEQLPY